MIDMCFFPIYGNMGKDSSGRTAMGYIVIARPGSHIFRVAIMHWLRCPLAVKHSTSSLDRFQEIDVLPIGNINMSSQLFLIRPVAQFLDSLPRRSVCLLVRPSPPDGLAVVSLMGLETSSPSPAPETGSKWQRPADLLYAYLWEYWRFWDLDTAFQDGNDQEKYGFCKKHDMTNQLNACMRLQDVP